MKVNVTWSTEDNAQVAGKMCAKKAVLDLIQTKIAILYNSTKYDSNNLLEGAKSVLGSAPIIGCTASKGIITQDGFVSSNKGFSGMMAIGDQDTEVSTAISEKKGTARQTGRNVAIKAKQKMDTDWAPAYYMIITTPGEEEEYLKGVQDIIGDVPCFGGVASDEDLSGKWNVYTEEAIVQNGVAVAFFYTNKHMKNILEGKFHETIHSGVITKVTDKRVIDEINGVPALKQYAEWTDNKVRDIKGVKLLEKSVLKPIGIKDLNGDFQLIKQLLNGNTDYSINISNNVSVNMCAIQMQISKDEIVNSTAVILRELKNENSEAFLINHSLSRFNAIANSQDLVDKMIKKLKKEADGKPFLVAFTNGEFGKGKNSPNSCGNLMVSETIFANN